MSFGTGKVWMNGTLVDWADAKIHVASHVVHYGTGVFEGARCYGGGPRQFSLATHFSLSSSQRTARRRRGADGAGDAGP